MLVTGKEGQTLAEIVGRGRGDGLVRVPAGDGGVVVVRAARRASFCPHRGGILQVVTVPIWIDPRQPEILGTLSVGFSLDNRAAARFQSLTNSDIAFGIDGAVRASTLPPDVWPR